MIRHRFEIFFSVQILLLVLTMFLGDNESSRVMGATLTSFYFIVGALFFVDRPMHLRIYAAAVGVFFLVQFFSHWIPSRHAQATVLILTSLIVCALLVRELLMHVWHAKAVDNTVIFGLMSGYIALGILAFLVFAAIEVLSQGSFHNGLAPGTAVSSDSLLYFAFITLLTIGYGDITPATPIAQKAAILIGLSGQFYLVILTAIVVGKYMKQHADD